MQQFMSLAICPKFHFYFTLIVYTMFVHPNSHTHASFFTHEFHIYYNSENHGREEEIPKSGGTKRTPLSNT